LDEYDPKHIDRICGMLFAAFGIGCQYAGRSKSADMSEPYDAQKLLDHLDTIRTYSDDKFLYLTSKKLKDRNLPPGTVPTQGYARYGKDRAIVSTHGMKNIEEGLPVIGRHAMHQVGHLWELHHCLDPRCSMYPTWTPSFANGDPIFCTFCREKSEQKIRLAKS
jgi:predicted Zn-dependent protease